MNERRADVDGWAPEFDPTRTNPDAVPARPLPPLPRSSRSRVRSTRRRRSGILDRPPRVTAMSSAHQMLWVRMLAALTTRGAEPSVIEAEVAAEVSIPGMLNYADHAIVFGPTTFAPDAGGLYKYLLRLRPPIPGEPIAFDTVRKTSSLGGYLLPGAPVTELIALFSLALRARLFVLSTVERPLDPGDITRRPSKRAPARYSHSPREQGILALYACQRAPEAARVTSGAVCYKLPSNREGWYCPRPSLERGACCASCALARRALGDRVGKGVGAFRLARWRASRGPLRPAALRAVPRDDAHGEAPHDPRAPPHDSHARALHGLQHRLRGRAPPAGGPQHDEAIPPSHRHAPARGRAPARHAAPLRP